MAGITDDDLLVFWVRLCDDMIFLLIWCERKKIKKNQLFFPYISWDKYHYAPILLLVILSSKRPS